MNPNTANTHLVDAESLKDTSLDPSKSLKNRHLEARSRA